ncbi:hypothetical protein BDN72DRAFT_131337 [Pluteus cervinus]|uniref:Uncharacterized protein n=1 Tax=Pluteus cervinus TaxID=181527 RepID=A0ACD3AMB3_9AGAR|nr:hypothetical protein BDN72DRAFT_131337 [Pluteus cervinus]
MYHFNSPSSLFGVVKKLALRLHLRRNFQTVASETATSSQRQLGRMFKAENTRWALCRLGRDTKIGKGLNDAESSGSAAKGIVSPLPHLLMGDEALHMARPCPCDIMNPPCRFHLAPACPPFASTRILHPTSPLGFQHPARSLSYTTELVGRPLPRPFNLTSRPHPIGASPPCCLG